MRLSLLFLIAALVLTNSIVAAACGDGILEVGEQCDDGNAVIGDGCDSSCKKQLYYSCDTSTPNICKYEIVISLKLVGTNRQTVTNQAVLFFQPNYQLDVFNNINFDEIFVTSISTPTFQAAYYPQTNLIEVTLEYQETLESTVQSFQLLLSSTDYFWHDSQTNSYQLRGNNCQLTYQTNLWIGDVFAFVLTGFTSFTFIVGIASIFIEKWIGLELIQTYQSVFYVLIIMESYPYEFQPIFERLRYINLYDDYYELDFQRFYTLPTQLSALQIEKQFIGNINISLVIVAAVLLALIALAIYKFYLKNRLKIQESLQYTKKLKKANKYFQFVFGQVYVYLVLVLMFKIFSCFAVQLSHDRSAYQLIDDEINGTLGIITFLILFTVIIYIFHWYIMIPENLKEGQLFNNLKFWNMKFFYPVIYLIYQLVFICIVSIYFQKSSIIYSALFLQFFYAAMIVIIWPYNTPRKINRILHNFTLLYNQSITILVTLLIFRWKAILKQPLREQNSLQFQIYLFFIFGLLTFSTVLAIIRLCIFNKDVKCSHRQEEDDQQAKAFHNYDMNEGVKLARQNQIDENVGNQRVQIDLLNPNPLIAQAHPDNMTHFLNQTYANCQRKASEGSGQKNNRKKLRSIVRKNKNNNGELAYNPHGEKIETHPNDFT